MSHETKVVSTNEKVEELKETVSSIDENQNTNKESENLEMSSFVENEPDVIIETSDESLMNEETVTDKSESDESNSVKKSESSKKKNLPKEEKLSPREQEVQDTIKLLVNNDRKNILYSLILRIELAIEFVKAKKELKKRFYTVVNEEIAPKKFVERAMKLVLKTDVDFKKAMSNNGGKKDLDNNVKLLVLDERITNLTVEKLKDFNEPTLKKLEEIKNLSDEDFNEVISGLDQPYIDYKNNISSTKEKERLKSHYSKKPDGMSKDEFDKYFEGDMYTVISMLSKVVTENRQIRTELEQKTNDLDNLNKKFQDIVLGTTKFEVSSQVTNNDITVSEEGVA